MLSGLGASKKASPSVASPRGPAPGEGVQNPQQQASHSPVVEATTDTNSKKCDGCGRTFNARAFDVLSRLCAKVGPLGCVIG